VADLNAFIETTLGELVTRESVNHVRPDQLHETDTLPALVYWRVSGTHVQTIDGSKGKLCQARVTIESYSDSSRDEANAKMEIVRTTLINAVGTASGVDVRCILADEAQSHYVLMPSDGNSQLRYVTAMDYEFTFVEGLS